MEGGPNDGGEGRGSGFEGFQKEFETARAPLYYKYQA